MYTLFVCIIATSLCGSSGAASSTSPPSPCSLPPSTGHCRAEIERYFFNVTSGKCDKFIYGGCQGNENNFESELDCRDTCEEPLADNRAGRDTVKNMDFESGLGDWEISHISLVDIAEPMLGITPGSNGGHMVAMAGNDKVEYSLQKH